MAGRLKSSTSSKKSSTISKENLQKSMEGYTRCTNCGKVIEDSKGFYISHSELNSYTGRVSLCKDCIKNLLVKYVEEFKDIKISIYKLCIKLDLCFKHDFYNQALNRSGIKIETPTAKNVLLVWNQYITNMNSMGIHNNKGQGLSWEDGDYIDLHKDEDNTEIYYNEKQSEEDMEKEIIYRQNKEDVIKMLGYDPLENEKEKDKPKMYANLITMLNEDNKDDAIKINSILDVIRTQNEVDNINDTISLKSSDTKNIVENVPLIKSLTEIKKNFNKVIIDNIKENGLSKKTVAGANSLTGREKKLKDLNLEAIQVNLHDHQTAMGMQQVANISTKAIIEGLNFGDDTLSDIVKTQLMTIDLYNRKYNDLAEENRRLKLLCKDNDVDYKNFILQENWEYKLEDNKDEIKKEFNKYSQNIENESKKVQPISLEEYADKEQEKKMKEEKEKLNKKINNK